MRCGNGCSCKVERPLKAKEPFQIAIKKLCALACPEIGVKWLLFLKHGQNTFIKQIHIGSKYAKTDLRPLSTILGTRMRATFARQGLPWKPSPDI